MSLLTGREIDDMVSTVNELSNAALIEIAGPGPLDRHGDPGTPVVVWSGEAAGKLQRNVLTMVAGERERRELRTTFSVYDAVAPADELAGGRETASTVVIRDESLPTPTTSRWTVNGTVKETEGTLDAITLDLIGEIVL